MTLDEVVVRALVEAAKVTRAQGPDIGAEARIILAAIKRYADAGDVARRQVADLAGHAHTLAPGEYPRFSAGPRGCIVVEPRA